MSNNFSLEWSNGNPENEKWALSVVNTDTGFKLARDLKDIYKFLTENVDQLAYDTVYRIHYNDIEIRFDGDNLWILETYIT